VSGVVHGDKKALVARAAITVTTAATAVATT
jgi:hypothetical protein